MRWLESLDVGLFRWVNHDLVNPVFDLLMPFVSGNAFFFPVLVVLGVLLLWKGGKRALLFLVLLGFSVGLTDGLVCRNLKYALGRARPFAALEGVHRPGVDKPAPATLLAAAEPEATPAAPPARTARGSMPSSHSANWFAATLIAFIYYRRSVWLMLPCAALVAFSRIYNGVHYPSDVLVGAVLGAGTAAAFAWSLDAVWNWTGKRWFPLWWERLPSLLNPPGPRGEEEEEEPMFRQRGAPAGSQAPQVGLDVHWLRLGYGFIVILLVARWAYLASGTIQLAEDEAYQWVWSKHLALSYYSKPPLIAYAQFLGTSIWGDTPFGIRFLSPLLAAVMGLLVLRFFAREINARAGFFLLLIVTATPLLAVGSVLMTVDPLSVFFWTAAMLSGWRAVQEKGRTADWVWTGLWMGLGFLSKYTGLFQWLCWAVFFVLWRPARKHLRRPGPWIALGINLLAAVPVLVWNAQHDWITVTHVSENAGAHRQWQPTLKYMAEFLGAEFGLLNPVFFVAMCWAAIAFWNRGRHNPRLVYFFSMGAPLFLCYLAYSLRSRLLPNWIAPSVVPLFCLMVAYWDTRLRLGARGIKGWLTAGLALGFAAVLLFHQTDLWSQTASVRRPLARWLGLDPGEGDSLATRDAVRLLTDKYLPVNWDPLHRARCWPETAQAVNDARLQLLTEGKPVFIVAGHYGLAGQISFWLPEARTNIGRAPLVYCRTATIPKNQFYFWPGYTSRKGENAIYVRELSRDHPQPGDPPESVMAEFESVTSLGVTNVLYHGRVVRPLQLYACRGLR